VHIIGIMSHVPYPLNNMILVVDQFGKYIRSLEPSSRLSEYALNDEKNETCAVQMKLMFVV